MEIMDENGGDEAESSRVAPVIPLFGKPAPDDDGAPSDRHPAFSGRANFSGAAKNESQVTRLRALMDDASEGPRPPVHTARHGGASSNAAAGDDGSDDESGPAARERAERVLVRKLRAKAMSVSEARSVLRGNAIPAEIIDDIVDEFLARRYLDDRVLADLLVTAGVERKGQGRVALGRVLAQRGIPREIADAALAELPDDDEERALEFARTKAPSMARLDSDAALRRLVGQLSRRGYGGHVAMNAAKTALREAGSGGSSGVRFTESD